MTSVSSILYGALAEISVCVNCEQFETLLRQAIETIDNKENDTLSAIDELKKTFVESRGYVKRISGAIGDLNKVKETTEGLINQKAEKIEVLSNQLAKMREELEKEKLKSKEYEKKLITIGHKVLEKTSEINTKNKQINELKSVNETMERQVDSLQHSLELCCTEKSQLRHQLKVVKEQETSMSKQTRVDEMSRFRAEAKQEIR